MFSSAAKDLESTFTHDDRMRGRALVRRRRVRVLSIGAELARISVRGAERVHAVVVDADPTHPMLLCDCEGFTERGRCSHLWAAVLSVAKGATEPSAQ